ncbi:putative RNA-directed DNA polymerase [Senna tora]|uniref:Putative RNA-directed DNA polymerase n=1 Tax=Senna tora TaxID=362788 RepID=A0A834T3X1_9FABA|nr:putative RNA-directed DNA polymerase [Senna tora]
MTWRGLMTGKRLIEKELIRCIGNGRSTLIWGDAWIPGSYPFSIDRPTNVIAGDMWVSDLIDETGRWREDMIEFLMPDEVGRRVRSIRVMDCGRNDRWNWLGDPKGEFTVKQCYKFYMMAKWQSITLFPNMLGEVSCDFWKRLWKVPILPKHKMFCWRACVGILPTSVALNERGVMVDESCVFCARDDEDSFHVLIDCPLLQQVWERSRFNYDSRKWHNSVLEWLAVEGINWSQEQLGMCMIAMYVSSTWNEILESQDWRSWEDKCGSVLRWTKPENAAVKMNTDAGLLPNGGGVIGGVLRDHDGICIGAFTEEFPFTSNPTVLEAEALTRGMEKMLEWGYEVAIFESDAQIVIDQIVQMDAQVSPLLATCQDILSLKNSFGRISFSWVSRRCNRVAYYLVSYAKDYVRDNLWVDFLPTFLSDVIRFDG